MDVVGWFSIVDSGILVYSLSKSTEGRFSPVTRIETSSVRPSVFRAEREKERERRESTADHHLFPPSSSTSLSLLSSSSSFFKSWSWASLIKDNLSCKHLVLSIEEALVNFLQDDTRPSILVGDILWQHDEHQPPIPSHHLLRGKEVPEVKKNESLNSSTSVKEREAAYLAARERIFSLHESDEKEVTPPKSRKIPVVARRMIAHALGTKVCSNTSDQKLLLDASMEALSTEEKREDMHSNSEYPKETPSKLHWHEKKTYDKPAGKSSRPNDFVSERKGDTKPADFSSSKGNCIPKGNNGRVVGVENFESEQIGAAKRMFAHALGLASGRVNQGCPIEANQGN